MEILSITFNGKVTTACYKDGEDIKIKKYNRNASIDEIKEDILKGKKEIKRTKRKSKKKVSLNPFEEEVTKKTISIDGGTEIKL